MLGRSNNAIKNKRRIRGQRVEDDQQLQNVDAPLSAFICGHEGLRLTESRGEFDLSSACFTAHLGQTVTEQDVSFLRQPRHGSSSLDYL